MLPNNFVVQQNKLPMDKNRTLLFNLLAFAIVCVWGTTFVSSKVLINNGLRPIDVFFCRFLLAYIFIWLVAPRKLLCDSVKDELLAVALGVTGGSAYFLAENTALQISTVTNVSLLVCTTPLLTALLLSIGNRDERMNRRQKIGSVLAFAGMVLVVLNGKFALKLSPVGDMLAFAAAWAWAFYSLITKLLAPKYNNLFIIRKVFFYGLLTLVPVLFFTDLKIDMAVYRQPQVWLNLLFLGIVASLVCYVLWNIVMKRIGVVKASNYIYFNPVVAIITASIVIGERITPFAMLGSAMILIGMYQVEKVGKSALKR